ncbi:hypothetical protein NDA16_003453 [Ustilago loliicola]|nr:hypothetical protein NDA16_003453 [Ustilago loliicola]
MTRRYWFPALAVGAISMILLVLVTISTPTTLSDSTPFDFVRSSHLNGIIDLTPGSNEKRLIGGLKFGIWGYCSSLNGTSNFSCFKHSYGYEARFGINPADSTTAARDTVTIDSSWTRGLAVHVVAFVASLVGLVLTAVPKQTIRLAAIVVNAVAALLALIAFCIDIALFVYVQRQMNKLTDNAASSMPGPAFYMALIAIPVATVATVVQWLNWRSEKLDKVVVGGYDYPPQTEWDGLRQEQVEGHQMQPTTTSTEAAGYAYGKESTPPTTHSERRILDAYEESKQ